MRKIVFAAIGAMSLFGTAASATETSYRYEHPRTYNTAQYTFSALADGDLTVYRMNSTGFYFSTLGVKVNGVTIAKNLLDTDHWNIFSPNVLGRVSAGDSIEFFIDVWDRDAAKTKLGRYFSNTAHNADGLNHIFADPHPAEPWIGVPEGTFIGFEDTTVGDNRGDWNYNDYTIVVPNLTVGTPGRPVGGPGNIGTGPGAGAGAVPEVATWAMMLMGFGATGTALRSRRRQAHAIA
jgi:hypothetical protein